MSSRMSVPVVPVVKLLLPCSMLQALRGLAGVVRVVPAWSVSGVKLQLPCSAL